MPAARALSFPRPFVAGGLLLALVAAGCNEQKAAAPPQPQAQVSVVVLHPQPVAITAELPGRVSANLIAEVRPQVNGIIKSRVFKEGSEVKAATFSTRSTPRPIRRRWTARSRPSRRPRPRR